MDNIKENIKNMTCSICNAPEHSTHSFDTVYFNGNQIIAVTNKTCEEIFDRAFRLTFLKEEQNG